MPGGPGCGGMQGAQGGDGGHNVVAEIPGQGQARAIGTQMGGGLSAGGEHHGTAGPVVHLPGIAGIYWGDQLADQVGENETHAGGGTGSNERLADLRSGLGLGIDATGFVGEGGHADLRQQGAEPVRGQGPEGGDGEASVPAKGGGELFFGG